MSSFTRARFVAVPGKKREGRQVYRIEGDGEYGFTFYIGYEGSTLWVHVPEGFETDGPSIPAWARPTIPKSAVERAMKSAAVHDLLREDPRFSAADADAVFWAAMTAENTPSFWRWVFFNAVISNGSKERHNDPAILDARPAGVRA